MSFFYVENRFRCLHLTVAMLITFGFSSYFLMLFWVEGSARVFGSYEVWSPPKKNVSFKLDTEKVVFETNKRFLSFSIDASEIYRGFRNPSLSNKRLVRTVRHLGGGYLRLGGVYGDALIFNPSLRSWPNTYLPTDGGSCSFTGNHCPVTKSSPKNFSMSAVDWVEINTFSSETGLKLIFGVNALYRDKKNVWDPTNVEWLLDYAFSRHDHVDWQLGNEPNSYANQFGVEVSPKVLANDFNTFKNLLGKYFLYNTSLLVGPDVTNPKDLMVHPDEFLSQFLISNPNIDAITWHQYYTGSNATADELLEVNLYESLRREIRIMKKVALQANCSHIPMWIGETGSAYGGGIKGLSSQFITSLLWIDKLGLAAQEGIALIVRQSLYRKDYGLLEQYSLFPNPDYWVSILYKKLVGQKVLNITSSDNTDKTLRVYSHCAKGGGVVLFGVNIANYSQGLDVNISVMGQLYILRGYPNLLSNQVKLSGHILKLRSDYSLPELIPQPVSSDSVISIPSYSIFFLRLKTLATACH